MFELRVSSHSTCPGADFSTLFSKILPFFSNFSKIIFSFRRILAFSSFTMAEPGNNASNYNENNFGTATHVCMTHCLIDFFLRYSLFENMLRNCVTASRLPQLYPAGCPHRWRQRSHREKWGVTSATSSHVGQRANGHADRVQGRTWRWIHPTGRGMLQ